MWTQQQLKHWYSKFLMISFLEKYACVYTIIALIEGYLYADIQTSS